MGDEDDVGATPAKRMRPTVPGIMALGPFRLDCLTVSVVDGQREYPEAVEEAANEHWASVLREKPTCFDGPAWCLRSHTASCREEEDGPPRHTLHIELQLSSYKYVLYTHMTPAGRALPREERAGSCGLMAFTQTADGFLVFARRSKKLAAMPNYWHCIPAGNVDSPRLEKVLATELKEELGYGWDSVQECSLLALMDCGDEQGNKPEIAFSLALRVTAAEVYGSYLDAEDRAEHEALVFVPLAGAHDGQRGGAAGPGLPTTSMRAFLGPDFLVTDITRRGLRLYLEAQARSAL